MSTLPLQGKVILVTGALGQAGRSAVPFFLGKGASIAACDIRPEADFTEKADLEEQFGKERLVYIQANATNEDEIRSLMQSVKEYFGRLDGCYHNVYQSVVKRIEELALEEWEYTIRGTLTSTFLVTKYAAELMKETGGGAIVNTSSILGGKIAQARNAGYGAAKAGVEHLTRVAAVEYADAGIRVNAVVPGDFKSAEHAEKLGPEHMKNSTLIRRTGTPNEINAVAAFLLSDESSYVTGSMYPVNGGLAI